MMRLTIISKKGFQLIRKQYGPLDSTKASHDKSPSEDRKYFRIDIEGEDIEIAELSREAKNA
jgi:hypothetical protein